MVDVVVPKWGLTMEEATIGRWLKAPGDRVLAGEAILEIETDKATGEVEAPSAGTLAQTLFAAGDTVEPGQVVARIEPT
jgi:2-oxoglutarate dehydrogenase E2 component (dihydrolipoamide succinyltransferase)